MPATVREGSRGTEIMQLQQLLNSASRGLSRVPVTNNQFSALVSFAFNLGLGALGDSTLLRLLNAGDTAGATAQFDRWVQAGGQVLPGLVRRRAAERALFLQP